MAYYGNVIRARPRNVNGWTELLYCLYNAGLFEEGVEYAGLAYTQTESKPIFLYYKSIFLFSSGNPAEAMKLLEQAMEKNPKGVRKFIAMNPSILQNREVLDLVARYKKKKSI